MYGPLVLTAPTRENARLALGDHLRWMYGLTRVSGGDERAAALRTADLAEDTFRHAPCERASGQEIWQVTYEMITPATAPALQYCYRVSYRLVGQGDQAFLA